MKILFFVGKGGVGKSTASSLFAMKLANSGKSVILNSIDPAHNLHDIFQISLGPKPKSIASNLSVMETDLDLWAKRYLKETEREFKAIYRYQKAFNLHRYFNTLKYSPGLEEYAVLLALDDTIQRHSQKDYIIFDTPPTALTLKFLALPSVSLLWLKELKDFRQTILQKKEIITRIKAGKRGIERETDPILTRINTLVERYEKFSSLLRNTDTTRVFLVLNQDRLSLAESKSIWVEIKNLQMPVPFIVLNKCGNDNSFDGTLQEEFSGATILRVEDQCEEILGIDALEALSLPMNVDEI